MYHAKHASRRAAMHGGGRRTRPDRSRSEAAERHAMQRIAAVRSDPPGRAAPAACTCITLHVVDHGARLRQRQAVRVDLLGIPWLLE